MAEKKKKKNIDKLNHELNSLMFDINTMVEYKFKFDDYSDLQFVKCSFTVRNMKMKIHIKNNKTKKVKEITFKVDSTDGVIYKMGDLFNSRLEENLSNLFNPVPLNFDSMKRNLRF